MTQDDGNRAVALVVALLNRIALPYMLVGSYSSNVYGIPRATADADFVLEFGGNAMDSLQQELGSDFRLDSQTEFELITGTTRRVLYYLPRDFTIELFQLSQDPFDQSRFQRRVAVQSSLLAGVVWLPTAEDVVVQKLRWGRRQDLSDVSDVLAIQGETLDWRYISRWTDDHGTSDVLERIRNEL
ncbi:hypothetical protein [Rosistilla oblonga]|uniref:hypothetical protein n=1 Tax=Rosistilla oblonga TaxID=2527990 RepID=UPI003A97F557